MPHLLRVSIGCTEAPGGLGVTAELVVMAEENSDTTGEDIVTVGEDGAAAGATAGECVVVGGVNGAMSVDVGVTTRVAGGVVDAGAAIATRMQGYIGMGIVKEIQISRGRRRVLCCVGAEGKGYLIKIDVARYNDAS